MYAVIYSNKNLNEPTQVLNNIIGLKKAENALIIHSKHVQSFTNSDITVKVYNNLGNLVGTFTHGRLTILQKIKRLIKGD